MLQSPRGREELDLQFGVRLRASGLQFFIVGKRVWFVVLKANAKLPVNFAEQFCGLVGAGVGQVIGRGGIAHPQ